MSGSPNGENHRRTSQLKAAEKNFGNNSKKPKTKPNLTPEYIAEQRALREARKNAKKKATGTDDSGKQTKATVDEPGLGPMDSFFIKRPLLTVPNVSSYSDANTFKIMTYNVLAQGLINRSLFPKNGDALKWKWRGPTLANEIRHYSPDLLCMQEVDETKYRPFWKSILREMGHFSHFTTSRGKTHGQVISYNSQKFELAEEPIMISYDQMDTPSHPAVYQRDNTAMFLVLKFKDGLSDSSSAGDQSKGIIVGTTHLLWVPKASYERTRQLFLYMSKAAELQTKYPHWPVFLTGDFNSECFDLPYLLATGGVSAVTNEAKTTALEGLMERLLELSSSSAIEEEDGTFQTVAEVDHGKFRPEAEVYLQKLAIQFETFPHFAVSLYGSVYNKLHPSNLNRKNSREPNFSNWAHSWRGLLDYIFLLYPKDSERGSRDSNNEKTTEPFQILELLRMPEPKEMGIEPSGQPRIGQYPSDHLCMMATVSVNTSTADQKLSLQDHD
jgi:RNA exonuclease NGL2